MADLCDRRLSQKSRAPLLIGLSGGGDSLALLHLALAWARRRGRRLIAATVDHQLRAESAAWTAWCRAHCADLGVDHLSLTWAGEKPGRGLHAAARAARHRLLATAARQLGASVILLAHTADDALEAAWMRREGAQTPSPRAWSPSPVWPEGRDIFVLRPLLEARRASLRAYLKEQGLSWIEDPGNSDMGSLRARARRALDGEVLSRPETSPTEFFNDLPGAPPLREGPAGELCGSLPSLAASGPVVARLWLGAAVVCAGGGERLPHARALDALVSELLTGRPVAATLAGARVISDGATLVLARETRDRRCGRGEDVVLPLEDSMIWDGRFEMTAAPPRQRDGRPSVGHLAGRMARASPGARAALKTLHPVARGAVPALLDASGAVRLPTLEVSDGLAVRSLVMARLAARCGAIQNESDLVSWRNGHEHPKSLQMSGKRPVDEPS